MSEMPVAIVTNATEYAGPGATGALAAEEFQLVCDDRKFESAPVRSEFEAKFAHCWATATTSPEQLVADTLARFGRIDAVVSNDFALIPGGPLDEIGADKFRSFFEALTVTPFRLCAAAAPAMKRQKRGHIVLITSGAGISNPPSTFVNGQILTSYIVAREATNALARSMAVELASFGIQVNAVAPFHLYSQTFFPSPMGAADPKFAPDLEKRIPMRRWGNDEEIGTLIAVLVSGRATFVSGQIIAFSGAGA